MVNSRPLTYLYASTDEPSPITPPHFLAGCQLTVLPGSATTEVDTGSQSTRADTIRRLSYQQRCERLLEQMKEQTITTDHLQ